jgi:uncharacterized protein (UPF0261 family)
MADRRIVVLATLDTKADEARFLAEQIRARGGQPCLVDLGVGGRADFPGDITRQAVAQAAGAAWAEVAALPKDQAMARMAAGGAAIVGEMVARGEVAGVSGIGGGQGTWLASAVMRALPLGLPKLMVSTVASRDVSVFVGHSDLVMMPAVVDVAGLNAILRAVLDNAAGAICGMASGAPRPLEAESSRSRLALTMFGVTTAGGARVRAALEAAGYEVVVFHANGVGGATMEELIGQGWFAGVVDWTITELADELVGGIRGAGAGRLEAAGARGLPQVVVPGAIDVVNFGPPETVPARFAGRRLHAHTPTTTLLRTSADECAALGRLVAAKLNRATGPVVVLAPLGGFSALDAPGGPFEDPIADVAFAGALRRGLRPDIVMRELPEHINAEPFARAVVEAALSVCPAPARRGVSE